MNITLEKIIAWAALLTLLVVSTFVMCSIDFSIPKATTSIEESNISIPDKLETSIVIEEVVQKPLPAIVYVSAAADYQRLDTESKRAMKQEIEKLTHSLNYTNHMAILAKSYGYDSNNALLLEIQQDANILQNHIDYYSKEIIRVDEIRFIASADEYPTATQIWQYLKDLGYNDYVCAGIMGNLMSETGGQTLNLVFNLYDDTYEYYGICQWALKYCPEVEGMRLSEQLQYLSSTIENAFTHYGKNYATNFNYEQFLALESETEAALAFAKVYERCASFSYSRRQENATKAYNYFVG